MGTMIIHHRVKDYKSWRPVFERHSAEAKAAGLSNPRILCALEDPQDLTVLFDMADETKAKTFSHSDALKSAMTEGGVLGKPSFTFSETKIH